MLRLVRGWHAADVPSLSAPGVDDLSEQQPTVEGFWMPSMREVWHQSFLSPGVMVIVQGAGIRIVDRKARVWFDDDLRLVTVRRTFLGTLVLRSRAGGQQVRLLPGATKVGLATQTKRGRALMAQVPPELLPYRFNNDGQRTLFPGGFFPGAPDVLVKIPGQVKIIRALMLALCARGAAPASRPHRAEWRLRRRPVDRLL